MSVHLDDDLDTVHVRCGSDLRAGLSAAGFVGEYLEFSDPLCQGPVPAVEPEELAELRARYMAESYGDDFDEAHQRLRAELRALEAARHRRRVVLWFEHDSYDQLILARVLAHFATGARPRTLELICIDDHPEVERFIGLGQLTPGALADLWPRRIPVTTEILEYGTRVFATLSGDDAGELLRVATPAPLGVEPMGPALVRHLEELPSITGGLSRTQRQALSLLADAPRTGGSLFRANQDVDPLPFLGDSMFATVLWQLAGGTSPAIARDNAATSWIAAEWHATDVGRRVLAGEADWVEVSGLERWVGGVRIADGNAPWRWDGNRSQPVAS